MQLSEQEQIRREKLDKIKALGVIHIQRHCIQ